MWRPPPDDAVDGIRHEVRRARRRWNAYVVQRAAYVLVAVAAAAAVVVLLAALVGSPLAFVAALAGAALGLVALAVRLAGGVWRDWLGTSRAPVWVDRRAAMDGRLATLLELDARGPSLFGPLLVETTLARRRAFAADEVVPTPVPLVALAAAVVALASLPVSMRLAPLLEPPPLATVQAAEGSGRASPLAGLGELFRRVLAAGATPASSDVERSSRPEPAEGGAGASDGDRESGGGLGAALQASIRRRLWGERWARAGDTAPGTASTRAGASDERTPSRRQATTTAARERDAARRAAAASEPGTDVPAAGAAAGAGTGSDPQLFGAEPSPDVVDEGRFALGLAARVRTVQRGPRPPSGEAPDAEQDARPTLAARQRPDAPAHRATVPPAFAAIVRDAFAHRTFRGEPTP